MKHYFILNPAAGNGKALELEKKIWQAADEVGVEPVIHVTKYAGEAEEYVRAVCGEHDASCEDDILRFYACGGDGTLNEVVNGCCAHEDHEEDAHSRIEVANIPVGTGNDFIRNFDDAGDFRDIVLQMQSQAKNCDLIRYSGICDGRQISKYSINMFNIGFDSNVVDKTNSLKTKPFIAGPVAYLAGVVIMLIRKQGADLRVELDDGFVYDGKMLLIAVANGCYCGGGVKGIPRAVTDDGLIDVSIVKNTSRRYFVRMFPKYMKGTHLEDPSTDDLLIYKKCRKVTITPNGDKMKLCIDGEICMAGQISFEIVPDAIRFVVPGSGL